MFLYYVVVITGAATLANAVVRLAETIGRSDRQ